MEAVKGLFRRAKTYLEQLLCRHEVGEVKFDHHMSIMRTTCTKCGAKDSYWSGVTPRIKQDVTSHDL